MVQWQTHRKCCGSQGRLQQTKRARADAKCTANRQAPGWLQSAGNAGKRWKAVGIGGRRWEAVEVDGISVVCLQMYKTNVHGLLIKSD